MRAADTNVLVRVLARDDEEQVEIADTFMAGGAWVSLLVLQETIWVLERAYEVDRKQQALLLGMLLEHSSIALESPELVAAALDAFRGSPRLEFSDCLILELARRSGHWPLGTFDKRLAKAEGAELLGS